MVVPMQPWPSCKPILCTSNTAAIIESSGEQGPRLFRNDHGYKLSSRRGQWYAEYTVRKQPDVPSHIVCGGGAVRRWLSRASKQTASSATSRYEESRTLSFRILFFVCRIQYHSELCHYFVARMPGFHVSMRLVCVCLSVAFVGSRNLCKHWW